MDRFSNFLFLMNFWPNNFEGQGHLRLKTTCVNHKLNISLISLSHGPIFKIFVLNELGWQDGSVILKYEGQGYLRLKITLTQSLGAAGRDTRSLMVLFLIIYMCIMIKDFTFRVIFSNSYTGEPLTGKKSSAHKTLLPWWDINLEL